MVGRHGRHQHDQGRAQWLFWGSPGKDAEPEAASDSSILRVKQWVYPDMEDKARLGNQCMLEEIEEVTTKCKVCS